MSQDDAYKLGWIFAQVDGGCDSCAHGAAADFLDKFPDLDLLRAMLRGMNDQRASEGSNRIFTPEELFESLEGKVYGQMEWGDP